MSSSGLKRSAVDNIEASTKIQKLACGEDFLMCDEVARFEDFENTPNSELEAVNAPSEGQLVAKADPQISSDSRVLTNLKLIEDCTHQRYSGPFQFNRSIRSVLLKWMMDVCDHKDCEVPVYFAAVTLLDRFLRSVNIDQNQLQLTACACLLLASKSRQCSYLSPELLSYYTDDNCTEADIRTWETLVLARTSWELSTPSPADYVDPLLNMFPNYTDNTHLRNLTLSTLYIFSLENEYTVIKPSVVACAAFLVSLDSLSEDCQPLLRDIAFKLQIDSDDLMDSIFFAEFYQNLYINEFRERMFRLESTRIDENALHFLGDSKIGVKSSSPTSMFETMEINRCSG